MSPAWIRKRPVAVTKRSPRGASWQVLYRVGGKNARQHPICSAGTFKTEREAKLRRDLVGGWLALGLDPRVELDRLLVPHVRLDYAHEAERYQASRIDHADGSARNVESHLLRLNPIFGDRVPADITVADNIAAVALLAKELKPSSLSRYWATHRLILDFAGVRPNPARDAMVKLPTIRRQEPVPPPAEHVLAMLDRVQPRWRLPLIVIEQTAMAAGETSQLEWGDVDVAGSRFRLRRSTVKGQIGARARWVQLPAWLMAVVADSCPQEDRAETRRVFADFTPDNARAAMRRACGLAGITVYSPHDLRHRRISLWHGQGIPAKELAARAGHANAAMSLNVYSHVMPLDEAPAAALESLLVMPR